MYSRLYDSMIAWYRQWYQRKFHLHTLAALALAVMLYLNVISLVYIGGLLRFWNPFDIVGSSAPRALSVFASLVLAHLAYAVWKSGHEDLPRSATQSRRPAAIYMLSSVLLFIASTIGAVLTRP
jgi:hypothetical protein